MRPRGAGRDPFVGEQLTEAVSVQVPFSKMIPFEIIYSSLMFEAPDGLLKLELR